MSWLHRHLETFVRPVLGYIPYLRQSDRKSFTPHELAIIKNLWRSIKSAANDRPILLPGRDVWVFEVLARRENHPTTFRPDISRLTVSQVSGFEDHFVFDTGFAGSIPRGLRAKHFSMASSNRCSDPEFQFVNVPSSQVFPRMKGARALALKVEGTPKYWKRGFLKHQTHCEKETGQPDGIWGRHYAECTCNPTIAQEPSDIDEFLRAAKLTIEVYTNNAPRFVEGPLITNRWQTYWGD